jgi:predicted transcriptional regulator of viral defense system
MRQKDRIQTILDENHGYVTSKELSQAGIGTAFVSVLVKKGKLVRIDRGFYALPSWPVDAYLVFQRRYPQFVYSFYSALYLQQMTDKIITDREVTGPNGYHPYSSKPKNCEIHFERNKDLYRLGIIEAKTVFGNAVRTYGKEKTICDLVKNRKEIDSETFVKAMQAYVRLKDKDTVKLLAYAKAMGIEEEVYQIMELLEDRF